MPVALWEPKKKWFREQMSKADSITDLAHRCGVSRDTIRSYARRHDIDLGEVRSYGCVARDNYQGSPPPPEDPEGERMLSDDELIGLCEARGIGVMLDPIRTDQTFDIQVETESDHSFEVGVVSDTHYCSKKQQATYMEAAYDYFERHGIATVLHPGDLSSGAVSMHPGMMYEMFVIGATQQAEYIHKVYPVRDGIKTMIISGNHDHSHMKANGYNIVQHVCSQRDDMEYLGMSGAYVSINGISFYLMHPSGGMPYARSWRLQKVIEQFAPEQKPKVLVMGHLHTTCVVESYRNVFGLMTGCFEAQTNYLKEKGVFPEIGFSTLKVEYDDEGAVAFTKRWKPFYVPLDDDYRVGKQSDVCVLPPHHP